MHYHANVHIPGYLPEGDVPRFDTPQEAWRWLCGELERSWDHAYECVPDLDAAGREARLDIDERHLDAHTYIDGNSHGPGWTKVHGPTETHLGWVYEVTECTETECSDD